VAGFQRIEDLTERTHGLQLTNSREPRIVSRTGALTGLWLLMGLLMLDLPLPVSAQSSGSWYVNPYLGAITPDKPWHAAGTGAVYGLDVGTDLSAAWSAELDWSAAPLRDRTTSGDDALYDVALAALRVFGRDARFAPYVSLGSGLAHFAPVGGAGLEPRTEFMVQPGAGVIVRIWESADGSRSLALRPEVKVRWTHGWAHAPGNPVDPLYALGFTYSFGRGRTGR
jgi:hypothetical protein